MKDLWRYVALTLGSVVLCLSVACSGNDNGREHGLEGMPAPTANKQAPKSNSNMEKESKKRLPAGQWGTTGLSLTTEGEQVLITFDCADARIDQRPELESNGSFDVEGVFIPRRGGPIRMDDKPNEQPARFTGKVTGETLTLTIRLIKSKEEIGKYNLSYGKEGRIRRCL